MNTVLGAGPWAPQRPGSVRSGTAERLWRAGVGRLPRLERHRLPADAPSLRAPLEAPHAGPTAAACPQRPGSVPSRAPGRLRSTRRTVATFTLLALGAGCSAPDTLTPVEDALGNDVLDAARPALERAIVVNGLLAETCGLVDLEGYVFAGVPAQALGISTVSVTRDDATGAVRWTFGEVGLDGVVGALGVVTDTTRRGLEVEWVGEGWILSGTLTERCTDAGAALNGTLALQAAGQRDSVAFSGEAPLAGLAWDLPPRATPSAGAARWSRQDDARTLVLDDASAIDDTTWPGEARGTGWTAEVGLDVGFLGAP